MLDQEVGFSFEVVVVDNDAEGSGVGGVNSVRAPARARGIRLHYEVEPEQNIALARNRAVAKAEGDIVVFIDDDERAEQGWLRQLIETLEHGGFDGVFGPVLAEYPAGFPEWLTRRQWIQRPRLPTGTPQAGIDGWTGNAAIQSSVLALRSGPFAPEYGLTGGSDTDLFAALDREHGARFGWANEAVVYELQDRSRASPRWYLRRAYRAGWIRAHRALDERGILGGVEVMIKILPSTGILMVRALRELRSPRVMLLLVGMAVCAQAGKLGAFLGLKVEEYRAGAQRGR